MNNTIQALQELYVAFGGLFADVANMSIIPEVIFAMARLVGIKPITVFAISGSESVFETVVSSIQTDVTIADGKITGTLKYLSTGALPAVWGEGNFLALQFASDNGDAIIRVGLDPSVSSGLVPLDEDMKAVCKITDKNAQKFVVETEMNGVTKVQTFDLSGLSVEGAE